MTATVESMRQSRQTVPNWDQELDLHRRGCTLVAGVDEAGRGAWAGPLVAGAVILPHPARLTSGKAASALASELACLRDSKMLSASMRERLLGTIQSVALAVGVGIVSPGLIDAIGLGPANRLAMSRAVYNLGVQPHFLLVDAFRLPSIRVPHRPIIRGDATCMTIAAASIVAKVTRDRMMEEQEAHYPGYGFAQHKGYGTRLHTGAIGELGVLQIHRRSFAPIKAIVSGEPLDGSVMSVDGDECAL